MYPTRHSWIITAHISLGNLECHWKLFKRQTIRTQQFLRSLEQYPSASTQLLATLQLELTNIQDIYKSNEATIVSAINLLNSNQLQPITRCKRSLLPFLGTALSWLTETATTKDICSIRARINQLIATQSSQCDTLVHIISILNVTHYATQVNRHSINKLINAVHTASQDIENLYNVTTFFSIQHFFQPDDTTHQVSVCKSLWFHTLPAINLHTNQGLHRCCHFRNTFTTCTTCCRSAENATTHCGHLTSNLTLTHITIGHPPLLLIPMYTCPDRK